MDQEYTRRAFLKNAIVATAALNLPGKLLAANSEDGLEALLHKSLTPGVKKILPANLDLNVIEALENKEKGRMSIMGRFLRTYRWQPLIEGYEKAHNIENGLLGGIIMQESLGYPLALGPTADAGLWMIIPGTARGLGLKVGAETTTALKKLVAKHKHNYGKLAAADERFDVLKSSKAAIGYLVQLRKDNIHHNKGSSYNSWDNALSAYNQGKPALKPSSTKYVKGIRYWQAVYMEQLDFVKKHMSKKIDSKALGRLEELNRNNFKFDHKKGKCFYMVVDGDTPSQIVSRFNSQHGKTYGKLRYQDVFGNSTIYAGKIYSWSVVPKK